jgi:hypothetical protein
VRSRFQIFPINFNLHRYSAETAAMLAALPAEGFTSGGFWYEEKEIRW